MSYRPPFARMRQIKRDAPPPISKTPTNVEDALVKVSETVIVVEEPVQPSLPAFPVIEPEVIEPEVLEPEDIEPEVVGPTPKFNAQMKKADLIAIAQGMGLVVDETMTKNQILAALQGE